MNDHVIKMMNAFLQVINLKYQIHHCFILQKLLTVSIIGTTCFFHSFKALKHFIEAVERRDMTQRFKTLCASEIFLKRILEILACDSALHNFSCFSTDKGLYKFLGSRALGIKFDCR